MERSSSKKDVTFCELHQEPFAVSTDKEMLSTPVDKNSNSLFYKNDFLIHEAHVYSKFKNKLKTMPASAAK